VIIFVIAAAVMVAAAVAIVLVPLLRRHTATDVVREASNVALLRDQLADLERDLDAGTIGNDQYEQAKLELEQRVIEESKAQAAPAAVPSRAGAITAGVLGGVIPVAAVIIYLLLGGTQAFAPQAATAEGGGDQHAMSPAKIEEMLGTLKAKLAQEPGNAEGWVILARTYYSMGRNAEAVPAFEKATALLPDDANLYADYADVLGGLQGGLDGKPTELVERALKLDPTQWKALALAGTIAFDRKDYAKAVEYWERMKATVPPGSPMAQMATAPLSPRATRSVPSRGSTAISHSMPPRPRTSPT
jgi:cytochrome c-type biogenesis protein CcmH